MSRPFEPDGRYAALDNTTWWLLWRATHDPDAEIVERAHRALGELVMHDWLDLDPVEPDRAGRSPERIAAMNAARDDYQDHRIADRCELGIRELGRLRAAERPFRHTDLDRTARLLLPVAGDCFRLADERREEAQAGWR